MESQGEEKHGVVAARIDPVPSTVKVAWEGRVCIRPPSLGAEVSSMGIRGQGRRT